jgi:hypothetical protein
MMGLADLPSKCLFLPSEQFENGSNPRTSVVNRLVVQCIFYGSMDSLQEKA